jgi:hypothetical protein
MEIKLLKGVFFLKNKCKKDRCLLKLNRTQGSIGYFWETKDRK